MRKVTKKMAACGWNTPTTLERLNGLPGVRCNIAKGLLFLNGDRWTGEWKLIMV